MTDSLFDRLRATISCHVADDYDSIDVASVVRNVLFEMLDATPAEIRKALDENREPASISYDEYLNRASAAQQAYARMSAPSSE
jgi:hypothetical protein